MDSETLSSIKQVFVTGCIVYPALILALRLTGKRTLSKMNAFDLIVTIALGSTVSSTLLTASVSIWKGLSALFFLVGAQFLVAWLAARSKTFSGIIKAEPSLLFHDGRFLEAAMKRERVTKDEILAAIRSQGKDDPESVYAVVLETEGTLSVVPQRGASLQNVNHTKDSR